ncbi:MAG: TetR/AcrR family transcriptional regulator [Sciscionella sp.]
MSTNDVRDSRRVRGRNDPERRERIAKAALQVVAERGVEGLTHRAVAATAGVPLGSTTYHFATLDDLLAVALHNAADEDAAQIREWEARLPPDADFAEALAELVLRYLGEDRHSTLVAYELYVAALHRPRLRAISIAWDAALLELFIARTDPDTGRLLAVAYCGLLMQAVLSDPPPARQQVEAIFRRALRPG